MYLKLSFHTLLLGTLLALPVQGAIIINETDADTDNTPSTDFAEFIELYSDSGGITALDGLAIVLINGNGNVTYTAGLDLDGQSTDSTGYYVIGSTSVVGADNTSLLGAGNILQNGVDAVALIQGNPPAAATTLATLLGSVTVIDAVVYKTGADVDGVGLDTGLLLGGGVVDEFGLRNGTAAAGVTDSIGRFPNASGSSRNTTSWTSLTPTPGGPNSPAVPEPATVVLIALAAVTVSLRRRGR